MKRFVVGITGASGIILARKLIEVLAASGHFIELLITHHALYTAKFELDCAFHPDTEGEQFGPDSGKISVKKFIAGFAKTVRDKISSHAIQDVGCPVASGSYPVDGMIIIPCSMATVAAVALGLADNALRRAADVTIKEKRPLIIVPRETPLSEIHLENLLKLSRLGATILPPTPAWYTNPKTLDDIENFIVGKVLDLLQITHTLYPRWGIK